MDLPPDLKGRDTSSRISTSHLGHVLMVTRCLLYLFDLRRCFFSASSSLEKRYAISSAGVGMGDGHMSIGFHSMSVGRNLLAGCNLILAHLPELLLLLVLSFTASI